MTEYYKVVNEELKSITVDFVYGSHSGKCVQYRVGEFVYPSVIGDGLFVFNSLKSAINTIKYNGWKSANPKIFKCEVEGILERDVSKYPDGTVLVYGVKLIEEVKEENVINHGDIYVINNQNKYIFLRKGENWSCENIEDVGYFGTAKTWPKNLTVDFILNGFFNVSKMKFVANINDLV